MHTESTALDFPALRDEMMALLAANRIVLPGIPEVAQQVRRAASDPNTSLAEIADIAAQDPALAAHLIKVSNAVALRRGEEVRTLRSAATRLGARLIAVTATSFAILQMVALSPRHATRLRTVYQQSLDVGERCYALALRHPHLTPEDALLAGLVHAIGVPVILQYVRDKPKLQITTTLEALTQEVQAAVGAELLRLWHFPAHIVTAVALHEDLHRGTAYEPADYGDLLIAAKLGLTRESDHIFAPGTPPALARLGLGADSERQDAARNAPESGHVQELCRLLKDS